MQFGDTSEEAGFRETVRSFLRDEFPERFSARAVDWDMFGFGGRPDQEFATFLLAWDRKLSARGWSTPSWPREYGGAGFTIKQQFILNEEFAWRRAPRPNTIGHAWGGPTLMLYGTEEQRREYLPKIISGDHYWCQLFSEPGAGSDLASIQTRAVRDGDEYVVNGQKIWTSGAHRADMGLMVARTDPDAPKHKGISYFLVNMKSPGIIVRPIVNMVGDHEFNEVFFEDVRIPSSQLMGEENRGWYSATTTLDLERSGVATSVEHELVVRDLVRFARSAPRGESTLGWNQATRLGLADRAIEARVEYYLSYLIVSMQERGEVPNKESALAKLFASEMDVRLASTGMQVTGLYGQCHDFNDPRGLSGRFARFYLYATISPVGGGTSEIQRNIIATRGIGLPRS